MPLSLSCPSCGAQLAISTPAASMTCPYCEQEVSVPDELRAAAAAPEGARLQPEQVEKIIAHLRDNRKGRAIKILRSGTGISRKDAKDAVDSVERLFKSPHGVIPGEAEALLHQVAIAASTTLKVKEVETKDKTSIAFWIILVALIVMVGLLILLMLVLL